MPSVKELQLELDRTKALTLNPSGVFEGATVIDGEAREKILADSATTSKMGQKVAKAWTFDRYGAFETEFTAKRVTPRKPDIVPIGGLYYTELSALVVYRAYLARTYADRLIEVDSKIKATLDSWGTEVVRGNSESVEEMMVQRRAAEDGLQIVGADVQADGVVTSTTVDDFEQPQPDYMRTGNEPAEQQDSTPNKAQPKRKPAAKKAA